MWKAQHVKMDFLLVNTVCLHVWPQNIHKKTKQKTWGRNNKRWKTVCSGCKYMRRNVWLLKDDEFKMAKVQTVYVGLTLNWWCRCNCWGQFCTTGEHTSRGLVWCRWKVARSCGPYSPRPLQHTVQTKTDMDWERWQWNEPPPARSDKMTNSLWHDWAQRIQLRLRNRQSELSVLTH